MSRELTAMELDVLREVQAIWGDQNRPADVFFTGAGEAVIFVRDQSGVSRVAMNLTTIGEWSASGDLTSAERHRWILGPLDERT